MKHLTLLFSGSGLCALMGLLVAWQRPPNPSLSPLSARAPAARQSPVPTAPPAAPAAPNVPAQDDATLKEMRVNEVGRVPILEYHEIGPNPGNASRATRMMHRSVSEFEGDLQRLYEEGYRAVSLSEYLDNKMDLPLGTSPVILTFDDARSTQFRYLHDGSIDPDCAVGILQAFHEEHADWPLKGTFYVLPQGAFGSERYAVKKLRALVGMGFELGNHTLSHHYFNRMSDEAIAKEIALGKKYTERMAGGVHLDTLALPGGCKPRSHNYGVLTAGAYNGVTYHNRAVLDAWGGPAPAPVSIKYDPLRIPRVLGIETGDGIPYYLDYLQSHPAERYVSDGDPNTVTVPRRLSRFVKTASLHGLPLHTYDDGHKIVPDDTPAPSHRKRRRRTRKY